MRVRWVLVTISLFIYAFLYVPIVVLVMYSFNASKLVTVWGGFSTHWYVALWHNEKLLSATVLSLKIAFINACLASVLGLLAGVCLARVKRFRGSDLFSVLIKVPIVLPDVVMGLSSLILFVSLQHWIHWPAQRGMLTIILIHATFTMSYVAVIVAAQLSRMDRTMEEAAMDLGARSWQVLLYITVPLILPGLAAGWLLAFTLSLDDLVIASFVSGPGATTLPMVVYSSARLGVNPQINAVSTLLILFATVMVVLSAVLLRERNTGSRN